MPAHHLSEKSESWVKFGADMVATMSALPARRFRQSSFDAVNVDIAQNGIEIERLKEKGDTIQEIAAKLDVSDCTIKNLTALKRAGEERLLLAAVNGTVPLSVAVEIAKADTPEAQRELLKAFETKQLNGVAIRVVKRLMDKRRLLGKQARNDRPEPQPKSAPTADRLVNAYKRESQRQKEFIRKARFCETKLTFIVGAFNQLLANEAFVKLLENEGLSTMPEYLWSKINPKPKTV